MMPSNKLKSAPNKTRLLLLLPVALLTACAHSSPVPIATSPTLPTPPAPSTPAPQQSYSERAQQDIATWQQQLMGILPMSD